MPEIDPRRASPGQRFGFTGRDGSQHELVADDEGVVRPSTREEAAILDSFSLPVARKAIAEDEAASADKPATTKKAAASADDGGTN